MDSTRSNSLKEYQNILAELNIKEEHVDYSQAEKYIPLFKLMDSIHSSVIVVSDFYKKNYYYVSERANDLFGFSEKKLPDTDQMWYRSRFHPDDYVINAAGVEFHKFIITQPIETRKNFKITHDFRIKTETHGWLRLIVQDIMLELDQIGNLWLVMKLCDLSPVQDIEAPGTSVCRNSLTNEIIFSLEGKHENNISNISDREREVLALIAEGHRSKEIAEKLFISTNTVNNHRRNMIKKLNVSNSSEAIKYAYKLGII